MKTDPALDLVLERTIDVPPSLVWLAWTTPEHLKKWFTPAPWTVTACEIDLRPGGIFHTLMRSPEGVEYPNTGCYLEVVPNQKLTWTSALQPGFRPRNSDDPHGIGFFTATILIEPAGSRTKYTAIVLHKDEESRKKHEDMGFHQGWAICAEQLAALVE